MKPDPINIILFVERIKTRYMTQEITVFNWFGDAVLTKMVNIIPFQAMANKMTGDWYDMLVKEEKKAGNGRGNLQMD